MNNTAINGLEQSIQDSEGARTITNISIFQRRQAVAHVICASLPPGGLLFSICPPLSSTQPKPGDHTGKTGESQYTT
jgi:hypothetical protein